MVHVDAKAMRDVVESFESLNDPRERNGERRHLAKKRTFFFLRSEVAF
jgi:hypothetical protein